jgi:hypothetical protein
MKTDDIDLVIAGANGDPSLDQIYEELYSSAFSGIARIPYKWLAGSIRPLQLLHFGCNPVFRC